MQDNFRGKQTMEWNTGSYRLFRQLVLNLPKKVYSTYILSYNVDGYDNKANPGF